MTTPTPEEPDVEEDVYVSIPPIRTENYVMIAKDAYQDLANALATAERERDEARAEVARLREFYEAQMAVEEGILDWDLQHEAVERLKRARAALHHAEEGS